MSTIINSSKPVSSADEAMLTPEQVIEELRVLRGRIPEFTELQERREVQRIRNTSRVNVQLDHESVNAAGATEFVRQVIGSTPDDIRVAEDEVSRWSSVENELRGVLKGVTTANLIRRQRIATALRRAYSVSRALVRQEQYAQFRPHVEAIFRLRTRKRSKPAPPPDDQLKK
jgi:hypothetical protein